MDTIRTYNDHTPTYLVNIPELVEIRKAIGGRRVVAIPEGSAVYFSKSSSFSRLKFRSWAARYKCRITRSVEKADVIVLDVTPYNTILQNMTEQVFHVGGVKAEWGSFQYSRHFGHNFSGKKTYPGHRVKYKCVSGSQVTLSEREAVEEMGKFPHVRGKFISSKALADLIFTETMGDDEYATISDMLASDDKADYELGVELLSNFNWVGSAYYITKLFYNHFQKISQSKNLKSVTFAHLKPLFEEYTGLHYSSQSEFQALFGFLVLKGREALVADEYVITSLRAEVQRDVDKLCNTLGKLTNIRLIDLNVQIDTPNSDKTYRINF